MPRPRPTEGGSIQQRLRSATPEELDAIPWLNELEPAARTRVEPALVVANVRPGELLCRVGGPPNYWFGVIEGLLKMSNDRADGGLITYSGLPPGGWFGEGTLLKREPYRYNIQALRHSVVAGLPSDTFHALLDQSILFNRFIMKQFNERLGQFIAAHETDRLDNPDARVARSLAALFNPVLFPGPRGSLLRITQQELAYLVGLSRQSVNKSLIAMQQHGAIRIEYGGLRVLDLKALSSDELIRAAGRKAG
jgi:CRP/FNR family cyclic AMP-dependent transcriptional regulator